MADLGMIKKTGPRRQGWKTGGQRDGRTQASKACPHVTPTATPQVLPDPTRLNGVLPTPPSQAQQVLTTDMLVKPRGR